MIDRLSFSGAGWRLSFHLGVARYLLEQRIIVTQTVQAGGSSAGSVAALALLLGLNMEEFHQSLKEAASKIQYRYKIAGGNWTEVVSNAIKKTLIDPTEDVAERVSGRLVINVSQFPLRKARISNFQDNNHLLDTLLATQFIPTICQEMKKPGNGWLYFDGSVTDNFPDLGPGTLKVGFAFDRGDKPDIKPKIKSHFGNTVRPNLKVMDRLFQDGFDQAEAYFNQHKTVAGLHLDTLLPPYLKGFRQTQ